MFSRRIVFVIGAGASFELGFPLGDNLKDDIAASLNILFKSGYEQTSGDYQIAELLRRRAQARGLQNWNDLLGKAWQIRDALPGALSIDNVLDAHSSDADLVFCGKLAICKSILAAERSSKLYGARGPHDPTIFQKVAGTYLIPLFQMMTENVRKEKPDDCFRHLSIITFNYDRSIERFLPEALATYYGIQTREAEELVSQLEIIHPYGQVGKMPGYSVPGVTYGEESAPISEIAEQIQTFSEGIGDESLQSQIRDTYFGAETVVFLGFAFHPINMELLGSGGVAKAKRIVGTSYGLADPSRLAAEELIMQSLGKTEIGKQWEGKMHEYVERIDLEDQPAAKLLRAHFRGIV